MSRPSCVAGDSGHTPTYLRSSIARSRVPPGTVCFVCPNTPPVIALGWCHALLPSTAPVFRIWLLRAVVRAKALQTAFYPCRTCVSAGHLILYALKSACGSMRSGPFSESVGSWPTLDCYGPAPPARRCLFSCPAVRRYAVVKAPSGKTPVSRNFHSSMISFRETATMPIRRSRLPPAAYRFSNHWVRGLCFCQRIQSHAIR